MNNTKIRRGARKTLALTAAAALLCAPLLAGTDKASAASSYKVINQPIEVDGARSDIAALDLDNSRYIALRSLNKSIGLVTQWDKATNKVTVTGRGRTIVLDLTSGIASLNGQSDYRLSPIVQNGTTYVPLRHLLEQMGYGVSYDPATKRIGIEAIKENDLRISTASIEESSKKFDLLVNYPVLSGFADAAVQNKINATLKKDAELQADEGQASMEEALGDDSYVPVNPYAFEGDYTVTYNEKGKLSLYVDYYIYTGGAHGSTVRTTYTFDLATGDIVPLKDAAGGNADYVNVINAKIKSRIKSLGFELMVPFKTIEPDRDYFLKHNGIVVYFGQYEYLPYAAGMPEFEVPFADFR
ncbi:stalk domain-containing protein [Cohnella suwonensis]|uniref:Stalk domain-containing protein n=1 Tax=Cohnella suwonensis TaxID=696072 RepID=A0ABW0LXI2_9BACL